MEKEKLLDIIHNCAHKSNADLRTALDLLAAEFEETKRLLVDLSHHLDKVEESHHKLSEELMKRTTI